MGYLSVKAEKIVNIRGSQYQRFVIRTCGMPIRTSLGSSALTISGLNQHTYGLFNWRKIIPLTRQSQENHGGRRIVRCLSRIHSDMGTCHSLLLLHLHLYYPRIHHPSPFPRKYIYYVLRSFFLLHYFGCVCVCMYML